MEKKGIFSLFELGKKKKEKNAFVFEDFFIPLLWVDKLDLPTVETRNISQHLGNLGYNYE